MLGTIAADLGRHGLILRGGFGFDRQDDAPAGPSGRPAAAVLLVGHAGSSIWPHVQAWLARQPAGLADPLDQWSRQVIGRIAQIAGARAVSPSDRPYLPFQQWAMHAEGLRPSPLGVLLHPDYGPWHAYRGALLFDEGPAAADVAALSRATEPQNHPCDTCVDKPCLAACPVKAHKLDRFDYDACREHLRRPAGVACMAGGCLDRLACPVGADFRYAPAQQVFHMRAYAPDGVAQEAGGA